MQIKDIPWWNRPSNRIRKGKLDDAQLLSLIIWSGNKQDNAIDLSNKLLKKYSLSKISALSLTELEKEVSKLGAIRIKAMFELFRKTNWVKRGAFKPTIESLRIVSDIIADVVMVMEEEFAPTGYGVVAEEVSFATNSAPGTVTVSWYLPNMI